MSNRSVETLYVPDMELLTYSNPTEPAKYTLNPHLLLLDQHHNTLFPGFHHVKSLIMNTLNN